MSIQGGIEGFECGEARQRGGGWPSSVSINFRSPLGDTQRSELRRGYGMCAYSQ